MMPDTRMGHHVSQPLSAPDVATATGCLGVSSTTSRFLPRVLSAVSCGIGSLQEPTHVGQLLTIRQHPVWIVSSPFARANDS